MKKSKVAVYPGSFDPLTAGHLDIILRASKMFDKVIVAIVDNPNKKPVLSVEERVGLMKRCVSKIQGVEVEHFSGLLVNYMKLKKSRIIIRGLRAISDFEFEFQMALMNRKLWKDIETVFLMPAEAYTYLSSSIVKEIIRLGGEPKGLIPASAYALIKKKYKNG
ncbi:MAG: pantetheine-phosphate adenylyltransferase [Elusimicrobiota bacterium]